MDAQKMLLSLLLLLVLTISVNAQESDKKQFIIQLDSSISKITYQENFIFSKTTFNSDKKIQIRYELYKDSLKNFHVTDSCQLGELATYDYKIKKNKSIEGGVSHSIFPCIAFSVEDMQEIMSEKYHYKSEHIEKFCIDLFDKIEITKKTIFLD